MNYLGFDDDGRMELFPLAPTSEAVIWPKGTTRRLKALLERVEWQGDEFGERCASCGGRDLPNDDADSEKWAKTLKSRCGHAPDCELAALKAELEKVV